MRTFGRRKNVRFGRYEEMAIGKGLEARGLESIALTSLSFVLCCLGFKLVLRVLFSFAPITSLVGRGWVRMQVAGGRTCCVSRCGIGKQADFPGDRWETLWCHLGLFCWEFRRLGVGVGDS